jgi:hypothetical protein
MCRFFVKLENILESHRISLEDLQLAFTRCHEHPFYSPKLPWSVQVFGACFGSTRPSGGRDAIEKGGANDLGRRGGYSLLTGARYDA